MHEIVNGWRRIIQAWLYPPTCVLCGDPGSEDRDLCSPCSAALPVRRRGCSRCGANLSVERDVVCGRCQQHPPFFDATFALFDYEEPVRHLIRGLKFHRRYAYGRLLGGLLAEHMASHPEHRPELIIPVPLHPVRYRERGFNQTAEIARELWRQLGIPVDAETVSRVRSTTAQAGLSADERRTNIRHAFRLVRPCPQRHVALLDDVVTTGATVNELAKLLKNSGVERVDVWCCARADRSSPGG
jgi:ComF family protein